MSSEAETIEEDALESAAAPVGAGATLKAAREAKRLSLEHIAAETRIPIRHLETLETGNFDDLPSRTYALGFARSYARAVGLDETEVADQVREEMGDSGPRYSSVGQGMAPGDPAKVPSAGLAWFGGFAALVLLVGVVVFSSTFFGAGTGPGSLLAPAAGDETEQVAAAESEEEDTAPAINEDGEVVFTALEDGVWVRFYDASYDDGGAPLFEGQVESGYTFKLPSEASEPRINTGRPDAFSITIGGSEVPKLSEEPVTMGNAPISAAALLARASEPTES